MRRIFPLSLVLALALFGLGTASGLGASGSQSYQLHIEVPNVSQAANGDRVAVTGGGVFSVHPKSVTASGNFTHTNSQGTVIASGAWTATDLLSFEFYGCGVIESLGVTVPPDFCGGALKLGVVLTPAGTSLAIPGILTIFCIIGPQAPPPHDDPTGEGIHLVVPGVANFNEIVSGMNVYIRTS